MDKTNVILTFLRQIIDQLSAGGGASTAALEALLTTIDADTSSIKTAVETLDNTIATVGTTPVSKVVIMDDNDAQITAFGSPSTIADFKSPTNFVAVYTSTSSITISALQNFSVSDSSQIVYIKRIDSVTPSSSVYVNGSGGVTFIHSAGVITMYGAGTPFLATDVYEVGINALPLGDDQSSNSKLVSLLNTLPSQQTSPEAYTVFAPDDTTYDEGDVITTDGYNYLNLAYSKTAATNDNTLVKVIYLIDAASAVDYQETYIDAPVSGKTVVTPNVYVLDKAALVNILSIPTKGFPYMRIDMTKETDDTVSDSTITTYINKSYI